MVVPDLVTAAAAGKTGLEHVRNFVDDRRGCPELDAFEQRFADVLKKTIKNVLPNETAKVTFEQKHNQILNTLKEIEISDTNDAALRLCDEITTHIFNEIDLDTVDRDELREAVETAYCAAINEFIDEMPDGDTDRWLLERSKDTQKKMSSLDNELKKLRNELSYRDDLMGRIEPFERIDANSNNWVDRVGAELEVEAERELPFQEPEEFNAVIDEQFALVIGRAGLGKSRTLVEALEEIDDQAAFDLAVVISGKIDDPADFDSLARTDIHGDVLLVWDDLHQVSGDQVVSDSIDRLKNEFDRKGVDLHVRGAVRSEHLDAILPENWGIDELRQPADPNGRYPVWGEFEPIELESFDADILDEFIRHALEYHDLKADDDVIEAFVESVLETEPTPFYVDTICRNTAGNTISQSDINQLPENALTSWITAYNDLPHDGRHGDASDFLHTLSIIDALNVSPTELLVEDIFLEVFEGENFHEQIDFLDDRGWITPQRAGFDTTFIIHDVRLEAIAANYSLDDRRRDVRSLSKFLKSSIVGGYEGDLGAVLNVKFANYIFDNQVGRRPNRITDLATQHFNRAVELNSETPAVNRKYAEFLRFQGSPQKADEMYKQAIDHSPRDVGLRQTYIRFNRQRDKHDEVRTQYQQAIDIEPGDLGLRTGYALYLAKQDDHEEARDQYEQALDIEPSNTNLRSRYAEYLAGQDDHEEARDQYEQALDVTPGDPKLRSWYAEYLGRQDDHEEARDQYEQALDVTPGDPKLRSRYAEYLAGQDDHEEARDQYEQALDVTPGDPKLRSQYAEYLAGQDDHEKARDQYEQAIDIEPGDAGLRTGYALYLARQDDHEEACDQYEQAIDIEPGNTRLRSRYAEYLAEQDDHEKARDQYEQAIDIEPGNTHLHTVYAEYLAGQDDHEEARDQYEQAIDIEPGNTRLRTVYAEYLASQDDHKEAYDQYEQAIDIEPGNTGLRTAYAEYLASQDDHEEVRDQYEQAIDIEPGDTDLRSRYAEYLASQDDHEEARDQYEQAIEINPGDTVLRCWYAEYLASQDDHKEARDQYEQIIDIEPGDAGLRTVYAEYLASQDDHEEAQKQYEQAIEIDPGDAGLRIVYAEYLME